MQPGRKRALSAPPSPEAENVPRAGGGKPPSSGIAPAECQAWLERAGLLELAQQAQPGGQAVW